MKARIKESNKIIDVEQYKYDCNRANPRYIDDKHRMYLTDELELLEDNKESSSINWEERRYELAKESLQALIIRSSPAADDFEGKALLAIEYADALINRLKNNS